MAKALRISRTRLTRSLALAAAALLLLPSAASGAPPAQSGPRASAPFPLAEGPGAQVWPSLAAGQMVYTDCATGTCQVMRLDLTTRKAAPLTTNPVRHEQPDTDGITVVWAEAEAGARGSLEERLNPLQVRGARLGAPAGDPGFTINAPNLQARPRVSGNIVVWNDFRNARANDDQEAGDIYMYDIAARKETLISGARSAQTRPVTNGQVIAWVDYRNEPEPSGFNSDIYAYDLAAKQEIAISTAPDQQTEPAIWGNIIVWSDFRKGDPANADLYGYDLAARREFLISGAPGSQVNPGIYGSLVVWEDYRNEPDPEGENSDIYAYDLAAGREFPVFVGPGTQAAPRAAGSVVAWEENLSADPARPQWDIRGATLSGVSPASPPAALPGTGSVTFPETKKTVTGLFLDYWQKNGGLPQQGFPISEVIGEVSDLDGKAYTVQYFERAVFEYHPEQQDPRFKVLLSQLGTFQYRKKYPLGAPGQTPNNTPGSVLFSETGKRVGGRFLQYWQQNGGLPQQGFPISDEFMEKSDLDGKTYRVQYFERAVFEMHPEKQPPYDVLLSQLGTFQYRQKYGNP